MAIESPDQVNFFDKEINECPYDAYGVLRDKAPLWVDPFTGMFVVSRFEDIEYILATPEIYTNKVGSAAGMTEKAVRPTDPEELRKALEAEDQERQIRELYETTGWPPTATLDALDGEPHAQLRRMMATAFRPSRIKELDPYVEALCNRLFDDFQNAGECEWVAAYGIPIPLFTIGKQMGVPEDEMYQIKGWTDAWVQRLGLMQTFEERMWSAQKEIESQHYFKAIFDRLRETPEDTVLSDLVNVPIPEWDRTLTDQELLSEMMADIFVGGSETTTNAISGGMRMLCEQPEKWEQLKGDPEKYLPVFIEECVRLEGPVQGLLRETSQDVDLHGVTIPAGSIVNLRFAAGNRDERHFECPADLDLERDKEKDHLGYGKGAHFCLGAPLARRELYWAFKVLTDRVENIRLAPGKNDFEYQPNYFLRALKELHIEFDLK
jgi:cytochrome P450